MKTFFRKYFEAAVFSMGLLLLALMDPAAANGPSLCLFDQLGFSFCPGDGLGHSISYTFRGDIASALKANVLGPIAIFILSARIVHLLAKNSNKTILQWLK